MIAKVGKIRKGGSSGKLAVELSSGEGQRIRAPKVSERGKGENVMEKDLS